MRHKAREGVPGVMHFGMRSAQRLEGFWSYWLKMTPQKLVLELSADTSFTRSTTTQLEWGFAASSMNCTGILSKTHVLQQVYKSMKKRA